MAQTSLPLITLSEAQRTQALERFAIIRPALEEGVSQAQIARTQKLDTSTIQSWVKRYREKGLAGLANNVARSNKGTSRRPPTEASQLIEGFALQTPPRSIASIHRQIVGIAKEQGWPAPGYNRIYTIVKNLDPALVTMAHQGVAAYRAAYRKEFNHEMEPLSQEEACNFLEKCCAGGIESRPIPMISRTRKRLPRFCILRKGMFAWLNVCMMQVEHVLLANQITVVTKEVVETARKNLIIGPD